MHFLSGIISHYHEQRSCSPIKAHPNGDHTTTKFEKNLKYDLYKNNWVKLDLTTLHTIGECVDNVR